METIKISNNIYNNKNLYLRNKSNILIKNINRKIKRNEDSFLFKNNRKYNSNRNKQINNNSKSNKVLQYKTINLIQNNKSYFQTKFPRKWRIKSTNQYSHKIYKNLIKFKLIDNKSIYTLKTKIYSTNNKKEESSTLKLNQKPKNYSAYYYSGSLPSKNKYIVESIPQNKSLTSYSFKKKNNINKTFKIIDSLAKSLYLFQNKNYLLENKNKINNYWKDKCLKLYKEDCLYNYYNKNNINKSNLYCNKNTQNSLVQIQKSSIFRDSFHNKESEKFNTIANNIKKLDIPNKNNKIKLEDKKYQTSRFMEMKNEMKESKYTKYNESEYLYKKIFCYNKEKKKRKGNYVDNKLNLFYSENEDQYNQKINKINKYLLNHGKSIKHLVAPDNTKLNKEELIKKVKFMKNIVDYIYPNMVLSKVKEENKRIYKAKSLQLKMPLSKLILLKIKEKQESIDAFLGKSLNLIK